MTRICVKRGCERPPRHPGIRPGVSRLVGRVDPTLPDSIKKGWLKATLGKISWYVLSEHFLYTAPGTGLRRTATRGSTGSAADAGAAAIAHGDGVRELALALADAHVDVTCTCMRGYAYETIVSNPGISRYSYSGGLTFIPGVGDRISGV